MSSQVFCTCGRTPEELKEKGKHIMGCALRTRSEAYAYWEYEQALKRVQRNLQQFDEQVNGGRTS